MARNKFDNPTAFNIQNELRQMSEESENSTFEVSEEDNVVVTEFSQGKTTVTLFEREDGSAYVKLVHGTLEDEDYDMENYNLGQIKEIEFNKSTMRIYIQSKEGFCDWGVDTVNA